MSTTSTDLEKLKHELQNEQDESKLEHLSAALLGHLLDVPIAVAASGFQHGGDAGTVGQRRLRLECKRYRDTTRLSERELLGEIEQAVARDEALEAWILATTRVVPEQLRQSLDRHGEQRGVPIVIVDWADCGIPPLAALCSSSPHLVEKLFSTQAATAARALQPESGDAINRLKRNLESWCLGFKSLRQESHDRLNKIWNLPRESNSALGQNAAGGSQQKRVKRNAVNQDLNDWWQECELNDSPAAVIGWEGTGKTWATLNWLVGSDTRQPAVLVVPSSAVGTNVTFSESNLKQFLAERLHDVTGVRESTHWLRRLDRLLKRPADEGPILTIFFDGLNQEPSVSWLSLLKVLQGNVFSGRVRVIVSTRKDHFENRLSELNGLIVPAFAINVGRYDKVPGSELDQMLRYHGLVREDLHPDVLEMARTPRLFDLVVRFRDRLVDSGRVTMHRLLWEYGRDTLGIRAGKSFSEREWRDWLRDIARQHRRGIREFSIRSLGETVSRPDLTEGEVYARLSDIVDGRFATPRTSGDLQLTSAVVSHALGAALLSHLSQVASPNFETLDVKLKQWLDPIAGFDQPAEILRAAISILVEQNRASSPPIPGVLLTAWLQTQNVTDMHRNEIVSLAPNLPEALRDAVEYSENRLHDSARSWAIKALRAIPRSDSAAFAMIVDRASGWLRSVFRDIDTRPSANKEQEQWRSDQLKQRIGTDAVGSMSVAGLRVDLVDESRGRMKAAIPSIIEGFPLAAALPIFEAAAAELAVTDRSECWDGLEWICLLNEVDPDETARQLRNSAGQVRYRQAEPDIHLDLPKRIAALLLWLTGEEVDDDTAASLEPHIGQTITYEKDYLLQPSQSLLPLERRHAEITLNDTTLPFRFRTQRIGELWLDPTFVPPDTFVEELRELVAGIDVERLNRHSGRTIDDHNFEQIEPALARCAPDLLADLIRRKLQSFATCPQESRYWMGIHATDHLLLARESEMAASHTLRISGDSGDNNDDCFVANKLLLLEILNLDSRKQIDTLLDANLDFFFFAFSDVLRPLTPADVDALIDSYHAGSPKEQRDLLILLSVQVLEITGHAWLWIEGFQKSQEHQDLRKFAFKILAHADLARLGRTLLVDDWSWSPAEDIWVNHYGTDALIEAASSVPFDRLAPRLAPWKLLEAVRRRGTDPVEVQLAAEILGHTLAGNNIKEVDPGSDLSVDITTVESLPFSYSVGLRLRDNENENLRLAMDPEARAQAHQRSIETAASRISEARRSGADLFQSALDTRDFEPMIRYAPNVIDRWLEGCSGPTVEFRRRINLAEGFFLALCEALLVHNPERGLELWHVLRMTMRTRYIGEAGVEDILHMVFRVPDSPAVGRLRREIMEPKRCGTDQGLCDVAVAATVNGKIEWLNAIIKEDRGSHLAWRRRRAMVLEGFHTNNALPITAAWPTGQLKTNRAWRDWMCSRLKYTDACARHWWKIYLETRDPIEAYAAWVLFLHAADRRIWVWMEEEQEEIGGPVRLNDFDDLKRIHVHLNESNLNRAIKKREEKFDRHFLHRKTELGIGPWT